MWAYVNEQFDLVRDRDDCSASLQPFTKKNEVVNSNREVVNRLFLKIFWEDRTRVLLHK